MLAVAHNVRLTALRIPSTPNPVLSEFDWQPIAPNVFQHFRSTGVDNEVWLLPLGFCRRLFHDCFHEG